MALLFSLELPIHSLTIKNFLMFESLTIPEFGLLNLFVGRNNTGKSSILEAVSLLATQAATRTIRDILTRREENLDHTLAEASPVFSLFRRDAHRGAHFEIRDGEQFISARVGIFRWTGDEEDPARRLEEVPDGYESEDGQSRLELVSPKRRRLLPINDRAFFRAPIGDSPEVRCVFVPVGGLSRTDFSSYWSGIAATELEDRINRQMNSCFPEVERVSVVAAGREVATIAKVRGSDRPVPLRSLGEGACRLFGLAMAAARARQGVLLIDEVEVGIHYSVQLELWRFLAQMAMEFRVQIFAATHSEDAVRAFGITAGEQSPRARLIRLQSRSGQIEAVDFDSTDLAYARETDLELR